MGNGMNLLQLRLQQYMISQISSLNKNTSSDFEDGSQSISFENLLSTCLNEISGEDSSSGSLEEVLSDAGGFQSYSIPSIQPLNAFFPGEQGVSDKLVSFVAAHEGYSAAAYRGADYQNRTIGYGHVIESGEDYENLTNSQALSLLKQDLATSAESVKKEFAGTDLNQNQIDALTSFAFNLGNNIWSRATKLVDDIKAGASAEVLKNDFTLYDHCNGAELKGLYNRRIDEWSLFTSGDYTAHT